MELEHFLILFNINLALSFMLSAYIVIPICEKIPEGIRSKGFWQWLEELFFT